MYGFGNPLKFNDPTGHCVNSTTTNKDVEITYDNDECWRTANTIGAMWDDTDYWRTHFTSPEVFFNSVANNAHNGTDFFQGQLTNFLHSEEGAAWNAQHPATPVAQSILDDPLCGGAAGCQAVAKGARQVEIYCNQNDCVARSLDAVSTASAGIAAACAQGIVTAPCALPASEVSVAASGLGTAWTTYQVLQGNGDEADLAAAGTTLMIGINSTSKGVGFLASLFQTAWDFFRQHPDNNSNQ